MYAKGNVMTLVNPLQSKHAISFPQGRALSRDKAFIPFLEKQKNVQNNVLMFIQIVQLQKL